MRSRSSPGAMRFAGLFAAPRADKLSGFVPKRRGCVLGPIFSREVVTVPRRGGHFPSRAALVGLLGILGITTWQATVGFDRDATLGETANFGVLVFQIVAFVLLLLTLFFATLSAAS